MPVYMFQARYTSDAIKAMVANPQDREAPARALIESMGGKLLAMYFAMGQDDIVALIEAPDDQSVAAMSMVIGASGSFSGGATTKLISAAEAVGAMEKANSAVSAYSPPS